MQYSTLPGIPAPLSRLVYGAAGPTGRSREEAYDCFEMAYHFGFRVFDTANSYGRSEENLGYWLEKSGRRGEVVIYDKGFNPNQHYGAPVDAYSAETIRAQIALSLERLRTDTIDFYVLHRDDPSCAPDAIVDALNEQKALGRIRRFGVSNWTLERLMAANAYAAAHGLEGFTSAGPGYSLANLAADPWGGSVTLSGPQNKAYRAFLAQEKLPVFPYSSLARGFLSGKYNTASSEPIEKMLSGGTRAEYDTPGNRDVLRRAEQVAAAHQCGVSAVAIAWLLSRKMDIYPIIAPSGEKHIQEALRAFDLNLTKAELDHLRNEAAE